MVVADDEGGGAKNNKKNTAGGGGVSSHTQGKNDSIDGNHGDTVTASSKVPSGTAAVSLPRVGGKNLVVEANLKKAKKKMRKERIRAAKAAAAKADKKP